jgi:uncharacterized membrane-anchored protein
MSYLFLLLPVSLLMVSYFYKTKADKLQNTGKIPNIIAAQRNKTIFLVLALTMIFAFIALSINWQ